jgi:hypothetical protein
MLKLTGLVKTIPFQFTDLDGSVHDLEVSEFSIGDVKKLIDLQEPILSGTMSVGEQSEKIVASRIICAVKHQGTSVYFWDKFEDLIDKNYPNGLVDSLYTMVNDLNPMNTTETLDEKKSKS